MLDLADIGALLTEPGATARLRSKGTWSLERSALHCAQSIDFSMTGFPSPNPWLVRHVFGPLVLARAAARGSLGHALTADIPGSVPPVDTGRPEDAVAALAGSIARFLECREPLRPHFAYGALDRKAYDRAHALHMLDHFDLGA